jgi:hypothetical protein
MRAFSDLSFALYPGSTDQRWRGRLKELEGKVKLFKYQLKTGKTRSKCITSGC